MKKNACILCFLWLCVLLFHPECDEICLAEELSYTLRKANEFYRVGNIEKAREFAELEVRAFPSNVDAMLLLGCIEFEAGNLSRSKEWFRRAAAKNPRHPLIKQYQNLFAEIEHRRGPLKTDYLPLTPLDRSESAGIFKKMWFSPNALYLFQKVPVPPSTQPDRLGVATHPIGILEARSLDFSAYQALRKKWYLKAYLLYKDLVRDYKDRNDFKLYLAEAAIGLRRYDEAKKILREVLKTEPLSEKAHDLWRELTK